MTRRLRLLFALLFCAGAASWQEPAERLVFGTGDHTYEWVRSWAKLPEGPEGIELGYTHGCVVVDSRDRVYVNSDSEHAVIVFDPDGNYVTSWGKELAGGLHGMAVVEEDGEEFLYLTHLRGEVMKATLEGEILWTVGLPVESGKYGEKKRYHPTSVAVAENGDFFVADGYGRSWIHHYDAERNYVKSFGGLGKEPGRLRNPHGLWIEKRDGRELLVVADRENRRLQVFTFDGKPFAVVKTGIRRPCHAQIGPDGWVVADIDGKVTVFDPNGKPLAHLAENTDPDGRDRKDVPKAEQRDGVFISPHCAKWDSKGNLYVVDWLEEGRLTKLKRVR